MNFVPEVKGLVREVQSEACLEMLQVVDIGTDPATFSRAAG